MTIVMFAGIQVKRFVAMDLGYGESESNIWILNKYLKGLLADIGESKDSDQHQSSIFVI